MAEPNMSHLSIGEVLGLLLEEFPDITISKIRFLESQGLIEPERTPSGYRKFYEHDVELLRVILREQREHFLPLRVIKDRLDAGVIEASTPPHGSPAPGRADGAPSAAAIANHPAAGRNGSAAPTVPTAPTTPPTTQVSKPRVPDATPAAITRTLHDDSPRLLPGVVVNRDELCAMASITAAQLASLEEYGVIGRRKGATDLYTEESVEIAAAAAGLLRVGIDARHLRAYRTSVEREVGLYEQLVMPLLRQRNPQARNNVAAQLNELDDLGAKLRSALLRAAVHEQLDL